MTAAYREHGYLLTEIAAYAGLHYSSISKIIKAWAEGEIHESRPDPNNSDPNNSPRPYGDYHP